MCALRDEGDELWIKYKCMLDLVGSVLLHFFFFYFLLFTYYLHFTSMTNSITNNKNN